MDSSSANSPPPPHPRKDRPMVLSILRPCSAARHAAAVALEPDSPGARNEDKREYIKAGMIVAVKPEEKVE
jgi:hypothetical protein